MAESLVVVQGPHGTFKVKPPIDACPGDKLSYFLGPQPEFEVIVPKGATPGSSMSLVHDGALVRVYVPEDCLPGDNFHVQPPALMVKVPPGVSAGRFVFFDGEGDICLRARVPERLMPGGYFSARLPSPDDKAAYHVHSIQDDGFLDQSDHWAI